MARQSAIEDSTSNYGEFARIASVPPPDTTPVDTRSSFDPEDFKPGDQVIIANPYNGLRNLRTVAKCDDPDHLTVETDDPGQPNCYSRFGQFVTFHKADAEDLRQFHMIEQLEADEAEAERIAEVEARRAKNIIMRAVVDLTLDPEDVPVEYIVEDLLPAGVTHAGVGRNTSGKSMLFAVDLAASVAMGMTWLGHETKRGKVLVVVLEGTRNAYLQRMHAWCLAHGVDRHELSEWLDVRNPDHLHLVAPPEVEVEHDEYGQEHKRVVNTNERSESLTALLRAIHDEQYDLVVVDNFRWAVQGRSSMSDSDMGNAISAMQAMTNNGATTIFMIGHTNQGDTKWVGLTTLEDSVDTVLHVKRTGKAEQRTVSAFKNREQTTSEPIRFTLVPSGDSVVVSIGAGDVTVIHKALRALAGPSSKNTILAKARDQGAKFTRQTWLDLIDAMAADDDDPVCRVEGGRGGGALYVLDDAEADDE